MKTLLLVEHGKDIKSYALEKAKEMGIHLIIATNNADLQTLSEYKRSGDLIVTDIFSSHHLVTDVVSYLVKNQKEVDGVGTFRENAVIPTGDLADALQMIGVGSGASRRSSQNKLLMRRSLERAGFRNQPSYMTVNINDESDMEALYHFPKPCVIKPLFGTASHGVKKIMDNSNLENDIADIRKSITSEHREIFSLFNGDIIVEEYVSGTLVSIDGFVCNSDSHIIGTTEFIMGKEPYFTQISSFIPARLSESDRKSCFKITQEIIKILGFQTSGFHCELRLSPKGPMLVEIAARLPGGGIHDTYKKVYGIDMVEQMIMLWLGNKTIKQTQEIPRYVNYHTLVYAPIAKNSYLKNIVGLDKLDQFNSVWDWGQLADSGCKLPVYPEIPQPLYFYSIIGNSVKELLKNSVDIESGISYYFDEEK